jgi:hypothetical protein
VHGLLYFFPLNRKKLIQTLKRTTTPENRSVQTVLRSVHRSNHSVQTVQHSVLRSNRSVQTVQRSAHRSNRSVQTVHRSILRSNHSVQTVQRSVQSIPIVPPFGTPSVIHCKSTCRMVIYKYFRKTIKMLRLILSVYLRVYVLERGKLKVK